MSELLHNNIFKHFFNVDKQLLALPDETDYGHIIANEGGGSSLSDVSGGGSIGGFDGHTGDIGGHSEVGDILTRGPQVQPMTKSTRLPHQKEPVNNHHHYNRQQYKHDDISEFNKPPIASVLNDNNQLPQIVTTTSAQVSLNTNDAYDALSTEPTPSKAVHGDADTNRLNNKPTTRNSGGSSGQQSARHLRHQHAASSSASGRRNVNNPNKFDASEADNDNNFQSDMALDDIHTTRSSLAKGSSSSEMNGNYQSNSPHSSIPVPQIDQIPVTPSLAMHGPYGGSQQSNGQSMDSDDMMTSYTRMPSNESSSPSLSDAILLRDFNIPSSSPSYRNMSNTFGNSEDTITDLSFFTHGQQNQPQTANPPSYHRPFGSSLPISVLLNDLIKLARPNHQSTGGGGSVNNAEQSSGNKQQPGILQQLRSLPGPLLSLLQGSSSSSNNNDFILPNSHDASESNPHYHRVSASPTDFNSILARSLRTNILPAFPPPKGTPQNWIPPTAGGSYNPSMNSNADFVASNAAGFLRNNQQQPAMQQTVEQNTFYQPNLHTQEQYRRNSIENIASQQQQQLDQSNHEAQQQQLSLIQNGKVDRVWAGSSNQGHGQFVATMSQADDVDHSRRVYRSPGSMPQVIMNANQPQAVASNHNNHNALINAQAPRQQQQPSGIHHQNHPPQAKMQDRPTTGGDVKVPLGYNPGAQMQHVDLSVTYQQLPIESSPKVIVSNIIGSPQALLARAQHTQNHKTQHLTSGLNPTRNKRSIRKNSRSQLKIYHDDNEREVGGDEEEEYMDSRPMSVVRPDGRPMKYYKPLQQISPSSQHNNQHDRHNKDKKTVVYETAGSGLMSKLLGTASTNDELEEDADEDDDGMNEKRRDEMDDAEFGISNDERPNRSSSSSSDSGGGSGQDDSNGQSDSKLNRSGNSDNESSVGSGSTDSQAYTRRNQPRADIDFYGHPGEETRQLKYGILGSGNYEVVNGGIYPEADESTAAVNSIANYVRKPGLLLGGFPKLIGAAGGAGGPAAFMPGGRVGGYMRGASAIPEEQVGLMQPAGLAGEMGKGLSGNPFLELIDRGHLFDPNLMTQLGGSGSSSKSTHTSKNGEDMSSISKSNSKDRSKDGGDSSSKSPSKSNRKEGAKLTKSQDPQDVLESHFDGDGKAKTTIPNDDFDRVRNDNRINYEHLNKNSNNQPRGQGSNQFNSYQISPSKKVTIFSDQDLDSAPSDILESRVQL